MKQVKSSRVEAIGFEDGTLTVKFKTGGTYSYRGVPESMHAALMKADSIGNYLNTHIIGKYPHKRH